MPCNRATRNEGDGSKGKIRSRSKSEAPASDYTLAFIDKA
jgi:hypothetical protein